jgi:hypothetical protein
MRKRLHYTPNQITTNLYTSGSEWMTLDGTEYIGLYHTYTTNETFTQAMWDLQKSKQLVPYVVKNSLVDQFKKLKTVETKFNQPKTHIPIINQQDRMNGSITRYFLKKINEQNIIEIDAEQFDDAASGKIDNNLYTTTKVEWSITGPLENSYGNGTTILGVKTKNYKAIVDAEKLLPGIITKLTNLIEYYSDTDFVTPKDINA